MMEMGASKPWPDALEALTGQRQMDATAMAEYFRRSRSGSTSRMLGRKWAGDNSKLQTSNFKGATATSTFWSLEFEV